MNLIAMKIFGSKLVIMICIGQALVLIGCASEPKVQYAKQLEYDVGGYYVNHLRDSTWMARMRREVFIIENAPSDRSRLIEVIKENEIHKPIIFAEIERKYDDFCRFYFRSSRRTPIDFEERSSKFGFSDELHEHEDDLICEITMKKSPNAPDSLMYQWKCSCPELKNLLLLSPM